MKKLPLLISCLCMLCLCGCWDYEEISKQTIIAGISLDKINGDHPYKVGFEFLPMPASAQDAIKPDILTKDGVTLEEAINDITGEISYLPYADHAWLILISEEMARDGIGDTVNLIVTHPDLYMAVYPAVVKGVPAAEVFGCDKITSPILSYELTNGFQADERHVGKSSPIYAYQVFGMLENPYGAYAMPAVSVVEKDEKKLAVNDGAAVFRQDRLIGYLSSDETQYYRLATGQIGGSILEMHVENAPSTLKLRSCRTDLRVQWQGDRPSFTIEIELLVSTKSLPNQYGLRSLEPLFEEQIRGKVEEVIKASQEMGCDLWNFSRTLDRYHHTRWETLRENWETLYPELECGVNVNLSIVD